MVQEFPKGSSTGFLAASSGPAQSPISGMGRIERVALILGKLGPKRPGSNAPPEAGRDAGQAIVVCTTPDVCKTPIGSATPPIPYQITGKLGDDANTSPNVYLTGLRAFKFDSVVTHVTGDEAGSATGIKSGTVGDIAEPKTASTVVRVNSQWLVRDGDSFWMNRRNTSGELNYKKNRDRQWSAKEPSAIDDSEADALLAKAKADGATIETYHSNKEKTGRAKVQYATNNRSYVATIRSVDPALSPGPVQLAEMAPGQIPGQSVVDAAPNSALGDAIRNTTQQNAPKSLLEQAIKNTAQQNSPKALLEQALKNTAAREAAKTTVVETAGATVGRGAVAAAGTAVLAVVFFFALPNGRKAYFADTPQVDDWERDLVRDAEKEIDKGGDPATIHRIVRQLIDAHRSKPQAATTQPEPEATPDPTPKPDAGVRVEGKPDPCNPGAHGKNNCPPGQDSHHIIADYILRLGTRKAPGARVPGAPSLDEGPAICLTEDEHREVHRLMDNAIRAAGGASGTVPFERVKEIAYDALGKAKPDCKGKFEAATNEFFKKISKDSLVRAYKSASKAVKAAAREALKAAGWPIE